MKRLIPFVVAAAIALPVSGAFAAEQSTPDRDKKTTAAKPASGMGMMDDKQIAQMQENMKKMQQQMEQVRGTTDPKERQKLMQEHMQTMQENMKTMRGMGSPMMMGGGQRGGMAMDGHKDMAGGDMMKHHEMTEKRMDMMQMMMEQMMQHDQIMQGMPAK